MLPKVKDRHFLTPELAPIFTIEDKDLGLILGTITRIADGHGYGSDSGAHGHREYGDTMFVWTGGSGRYSFQGLQTACRTRFQVILLPTPLQ